MSRDFPAARQSGFWEWREKPPQSLGRIVYQHSGESPRVPVTIGSALRPSGRGGLSFGLLQNQAFHTTVCIYMKIAIFSYRRARDGRLPRAEAGVVELL